MQNDAHCDLILISTASFFMNPEKYLNAKQPELVREKLMKKFCQNLYLMEKHQTGCNKREIEICHNTIPKQLIFVLSIIHLIVQNELI